MKTAYWFRHLRDIAILPFTMTCIVPYWIYDASNTLFSQADFLVLVGAGLVAPGIGLFSYTVFLFATKGDGTLAPWSPTKKLVIRGPYRYCRNPMISAVFLILLGESLLLNSRDILIWAAIFFAINTLYFVLIEEPDLKSRFGNAYVVYMKNVPRWLPRLSPYKPDE